MTTESDLCGTLVKNQTHAVAHTLKAEGHDASEDGTGRGVPLIPCGIDGGEVGYSLRANPSRSGDKGDGGLNCTLAIQAGALRENPASGPDGVGVQKHIAYTLEARAEVQAVAFDTTQITSPTNRCNPQPGDPAHPLSASAHAPAVVHSVCLGSDPISARNLAQPITQRNGDPGTIQTGMAVRRLTPRECERLQGFPDDYTLIPWRGKTAEDCPDGPRYKALGNSMAVPVMRWIGQRIAQVDAIIKCPPSAP